MDIQHTAQNPQKSFAGDDQASSPSFFAMAVALFFLWGGLTSLNDILIPKLKSLFSLSYAEAMLTQFSFFMAYFIVSLPAGALIARVGYITGVVIGLGVMAGACLIFPIAAASASYMVFLIALFALAGGITVLQVAANPLVARLGTEGTSHSRLTFAQAFNSLGTTVFPPVAAVVILGAQTDAGLAASPAEHRAAEAAVIGHAYLAIAAVLVIAAMLFWMRRGVVRARSAERAPLRIGLDLLGRPRLAFGVLSIFLYVGAEVSIGSLLVNYLSNPDVMDLSEAAAGKMLAFYWGGAMLGRFIGSGALRVVSAGAALACVGVGAAGLSLLSASVSGPVAGWTLLAVGLMNAIMFPTIFSLALEGLGQRTPQGSGLLCMAIVGGAVVPFMAGLAADAFGLPAALVIPSLCYAFVAAFGWFARRFPYVT